MASGCSREAASRFLTERGGSVKNEDSHEHFQPGLSIDPPDTALINELFQMNLDNAALVNQDDGTNSACSGKGDAHSMCSGPKTVGEYEGRDSDRARVSAMHHLEHGGPSPRDDSALNENLRSNRSFPKCASDAAEQEISAVPGCGTDIGKGEGAGSHASLLEASSAARDGDDVVRDDGDPADDESGSVALDPLEHQWMMCASDGEWESLHQLLSQDPNLVNKKDFVTGFTCLHWAAKLGRQELLSQLVNFGKQNAISVNINARSSAGYTPLHLATIHNHPEVVKFLVGACEANVEARDYNGRMAWQYLSRTTSKNMYDILGGMPGFWSESGEGGASRRTASKVLPYNLVTFGPFSCLDEQVCDGDASEKPKLVSRKPSLKSRLPKIRVRSRIVHSTSFRDPEEVRASARSIVRSRPKSNIFG
uniref:Sosondowah ankyrin repeat domain family member C n=1 Tax=Paramormyrops kingsleyae TaxID=1676925 RepID=A0A3B3QAM9_9TELE